MGLASRSSIGKAEVFTDKFYAKEFSGVIFFGGDKSQGYKTGVFLEKTSNFSNKNDMLSAMYQATHGSLPLKGIVSEEIYPRIKEFLELYDGPGVIHIVKSGTKPEVLYKEGKLLVSNLEQSMQVETSKNKIKALIVDDSKIIRKLIKGALEDVSDFEIVGETGNPFEVFDMVEKLKPTVMTLDINMPGMTGVDVLKKLKSTSMIPTIVISSLSMDEGSLVMDALDNGAVDYIHKPSRDNMDIFEKTLIERLIVSHEQNKKIYLKDNFVKNLSSYNLDPNSILAIGASTGGTEAIKNVLKFLPKDIPPTVIVQHIPPVFSRAFAENVDKITPFKVKEAVNGDELKAGLCLIAPGGKQMKVVSVGDKLFIEVSDTIGKVSGHKPSVDHLFESLTHIKSRKICAAILTGMGADGAKELTKLHKQGHFTIAQNEDTCVVYGMPRQAVLLGGVSEELPLGKIPEKICEVLKK